MMIDTTSRRHRLIGIRVMLVTALSLTVLTPACRREASVARNDSETAEPQTAAAESRYEFSQPHMGTLFRLVLFADSEAQAEVASEAAFAKVAALDSIMSDYEQESELMRLCRQPAGLPTPVGPELFDVLSRSLALSAETAGAFDITVGNYTMHWRRARRRREMPDPATLEKLRERSGFEKVTLDPDGRTVTLARNGMRLDLGGIAKGYAADAALQVLREHGITRALVAASGDIVVGNPPPGKANWEIGIASIDTENNQPNDILRLENAAVSTSGDTNQYVEIDGVRYSHIVDPRTGIGLAERIGVTVVAPDATTSDSYATAVSILGVERGLAFVEADPRIEARLVTVDAEDNSVRHNSSGYAAKR